MRIHARVFWCIIGIAVGSACCFSTPAQDRDSSADAKAIRQAAKDYVRAIHQGDADKMSAAWTPDGDYIDASGRATKARDLVKQFSGRPRDNNPPDEFEPAMDSLRFITPDVAIEDGSGKDEGSWIGRFTAVWVKRDGKWLLDSVRESAAPRQSHHDHLRALSFLVGEWRVDGDESGAQISCRWNEQKTFLLREIRIASREGRSLEIDQRIGWDPVSKQIKCWTFEADGGQGQSVWTREGEKWVVASSAVTSDGKSAKSTTTYTRLGGDTLLWESSEAEVDGEPLPDHKLRLVRKTAKSK